MNEIKQLAIDMNCLDRYSDKQIIEPKINLYGFIINKSEFGYKYTIGHESGIGTCLSTNNKKVLIAFIENWFKKFIK